MKGKVNISFDTTANAHPLSTVYVVFLNARNQVALLLRGNTSYKSGWWCLPGGKIFNSESARQAALREAAEETGAIINPLDIEHIHTAHRVGPFEVNMNWFDVYFICRNSPVLYNSEPEKHLELKWFSLDNLPTKFVQEQADALRRGLNKESFSEFKYILEGYDFDSPATREVL